ncbi:MAG TPA: hypothetical protein VHJ38_05745 [Nitrososphaeraceae archaeon]|nr:hypothetical protein [Nitrososphaeraceae archaeon]
MNGRNHELTILKLKHIRFREKYADLIKDKLKEGHRLLKIERKGSGKDTLYIPTAIPEDTE